MRCFKNYILLNLLLLASVGIFSSCTAPVDSQQLQSYIPKADTVKGTVYYLGADQKLEDIANRLLAAMQKNSDWSKEYLGKLQSGEEMPYHKNLEISEEEYRLFLSSAKEMKLIKYGEVQLTFHYTGKQLEISINGMELLINSAIINLADNTATTSLSTLGIPTDINQNNPHSHTGRWTGLQWKTIEGTPIVDGYSEKFAIGAMTDSEEGIIYHDLKSAKDNVNTHFIIKYNL